MISEHVADIPQQPPITNYPPGVGAEYRPAPDNGSDVELCYRDNFGPTKQKKLKQGQEVGRPISGHNWPGVSFGLVFPDNPPQIKADIYRSQGYNDREGRVLPNNISGDGQPQLVVDNDGKLFWLSKTSPQAGGVWTQDPIAKPSERMWERQPGGDALPPASQPETPRQNDRRTIQAAENSIAMIKAVSLGLVDPVLQDTVRRAVQIAEEQVYNSKNGLGVPGFLDQVLLSITESALSDKQLQELYNQCVGETYSPGAWVNVLEQEEECQNALAGAETAQEETEARLDHCRPGFPG